MTISTSNTEQNRAKSTGRALGAGLILVVLLALALSTLIAQATNHALSEAGYADFAYSATTAEDPSGKGAESKVWWNDNFWWAIMYSNSGNAYHIYQLDAVDQEWIDTGVPVDNRADTRSDVLWDGSKLYVASHEKVNNGVFNNNPDHAARLYRFSYEAATDTYTLDTGFPVDIASYRTESMVLDKDSTGRLWITFVARDGREGLNPPSRVRINYSGANDLDWDPGDPLVPAVGNTDVISDDISSLVAFTDNAGSKIGVMWSNQSDNQFYFAYHPDNEDPEDGWVLDAGFVTAFPASTYPADDHIDFAPQPGGTLFAVTKTNNMAGPDPIAPSAAELVEADSDPLIGVMARSQDGSWDYIPVSPAGSRDTRPVAVVNNETDELHVFTVSNPTAPFQVCIHSAPIASPATMSFDADNCEPPAGEAAGSWASLLELTAAPAFIGDTTTYTAINSPSTVKGWVGGASGIVVLASDQPNTYYVHNQKPGSFTQPTLTPSATSEVPTGTPTATPTSTATSVPPTSTPTATATGQVPPTPTATATIPPTHQENIYLPVIVDQLD